MLFVSNKILEKASLSLLARSNFLSFLNVYSAWSESPCPDELPTCIVNFQYHPLWRFSKNKFYLKSSHRLKAISGSLIIIVNSYNLDLIAISLRLIKMSINRMGCGL